MELMASEKPIMNLERIFVPCCRGSGQIIDQGARLVDIALENGQAFEGDGWKYISDSFEKNTVHFIGLLSDGGVHSRYNQLAQFLKGAQERGAKRIRVHFLTVCGRCPAYCKLHGVDHCSDVYRIRRRFIPKRYSSFRPRFVTFMRALLTCYS